jgi:DNA-binding GntR family transcriptional regulator
LPAAAEETFAEQAAERLVNDILYGLLAPGQKLRIDRLKEQYGIGASPIREALSRLCALGLVTATSHRGFRVTEMSQADLEDITLVRQMVETTMLERAIAHGGDEWEVGIVAAFARLSRAVLHSGSDETSAFRSVEPAHKQFHQALVAGGTSPRLAQMQNLAFDQAFRYRDMMFRGLHDRGDFLAIHQALMEDVLSRDPARAIPALRAHLALTPRMVYGARQLADSG